MKIEMFLLITAALVIVIFLLTFKVVSHESYI